MLTWAEYSAITASLVWYGPTEMVLIISLQHLGISLLGDMLTPGCGEGKTQIELSQSTFLLGLSNFTELSLQSVYLKLIKIACFKICFKFEEINCD